MPSPSILTRIARTLRLLTIGIKAFIKLPFALLYLIPTPLRQRSSFGYSTAVKIWVSHRFFEVICTLRPASKRSLLPGSEGDRFCIIEPSAAEHYSGVLSINPSIKPSPLGAVWYPGPITRSSPQTVMLHFIGGAYASWDAREAYSGFTGRLLTSHLGIPVLCPEYRLASADGGHFPAAFQGAVTAYRYLLHELKIPAERIVLSGDSAGGHLVLGLLRYITEGGTELPQPSVAMIWSPWTDPQNPARVERSMNYGVDSITSEFLVWGAEALAGAATEAQRTQILSSPYYSPFQHPFKVDMPLFVSAGTAECMYEIIVEFVAKMRDAGNPDAIHFVAGEGDTHDLLCLGEVVGKVEEARRLVREGKDWLAKQNMG